MFYFGKPSLFEKMIARLGLDILRRPPEEEVENGRQDAVMLYHYCRYCRKYFFERLYDYLSKVANYKCSGCGQKNSAVDIGGFSFFRFFECARIAAAEAKKAKAIGKVFFRKAFFFRLMFLGISDKYLPDSRAGKTAGELELEATRSVIGIILFMLPKN